MYFHYHSLLSIVYLWCTSGAYYGNYDKFSYALLAQILRYLQQSFQADREVK